jgi:hypothetical protein
MSAWNAEAVTTASGQPDPHRPARREDVRLPPGTERPRRFRPKLRYELLGCGLHGHELVGTDVACLRGEDAVVARQDADGLRWYRCVRCDSWLPLPPADPPGRQYLPPREQIELPLRGRALRDRYVLRLIALDRLVHFLVLGVLAAALLLFAQDKATLNGYWLRIVRDLQGGVGGPVRDTSSGIVGELNKLFAANTTICGCSGCCWPATRCWKASRRSGCGGAAAGRSI